MVSKFCGGFLLLFIALIVVESVPNGTQRFLGIHLDVEPHTRADWGPEIANKYVDLLEKVRTLLNTNNPHGLKFAVDIPFWYSGFLIERNGQTRPLSEWVMDIVDKVSVMAYRDFAVGIRNSTQDVSLNGRTDSSFELSKEELAYGVATNTQVEIISETICGELPIVTYCEEDMAYLESQLVLLESAAKSSPAYVGKAVHHYKSWSARNPAPIDPQRCDLKRALFVWEERDYITDATKRQQLLNFASSHGVYSFMFHSYWSVMNPDNWPAMEVMLRESYAAGIRLEALYGDPEWASTETHNFVLNVVQQTLNFVNSISTPIPPFSACTAPIYCGSTPLICQANTTCCTSSSGVGQCCNSDETCQGGVCGPKPTSCSTKRCSTTDRCCQDIVMGPVCYSSNTHDCVNNNRLCGKGLGSCNNSCYSKETHTCLTTPTGEERLCGEGLGLCGGVCFDPTLYNCNCSLSPKV